MATKDQQVIVIGASAGGVEALLHIAERLPSMLPAPVFVVQHIGAYPSRLPELLSARGPNKSVHARDSETPSRGTIYVAPPDHHMLLDGGTIRVTRGPKEHHTRPAIDPLFRSAALDSGPRAVGVVLTGDLDDGTAGLAAIKKCDGVAVVQDPREACAPSMPASAIANVDVDHVVSLAQMPELLAKLAVPGRDLASGIPPEALIKEHSVSLGGGMEELLTVASPSPFTCPDCHGTLFQLHDDMPVRYRCHTGHAFTLRTLASTYEDATEEALWSAIRALQEKRYLLLKFAGSQQEALPDASREAIQEAATIETTMVELRRLTEGLSRSKRFDVAR